MNNNVSKRIIETDISIASLMLSSSDKSEANSLLKLERYGIRYLYTPNCASDSSGILWSEAKEIQRIARQAPKK